MLIIGKGQIKLSVHSVVSGLVSDYFMAVDELGQSCILI